MKTTDKNAAKWLSRIFSLRLCDTIGIAKVKEVIRVNTKRSDDSCASHDFCDANEVMGEAFHEAFNFDMENFDVSKQANVDLWNAAWSLAIENKFYLS